MHAPGEEMERRQSEGKLCPVKKKKGSRDTVDRASESRLWPYQYHDLNARRVTIGRAHCGAKCRCNGLNARLVLDWNMSIQMCWLTSVRQGEHS